MVNFIESEWSIKVRAIEANDTNFGKVNGLVTFIEKKLQKLQKR